jgi:hypothetical protein
MTSPPTSKTSKSKMTRFQSEDDDKKPPAPIPTQLKPRIPPELKQSLVPQTKAKLDKVNQYRSRLIDKMSKPLFTKIYDFLSQHKAKNTAESELNRLAVGQFGKANIQFFMDVDQLMFLERN